jgi:hypothetical protein
MLSNTYASADIWSDPIKVRHWMEDTQAWGNCPLAVLSTTDLICIMCKTPQNSVIELFLR